MEVIILDKQHQKLLLEVLRTQTLTPLRQKRGDAAYAPVRLLFVAICNLPHAGIGSGKAVVFLALQLPTK
jgi:hypothetical protein